MRFLVTYDLKEDHTKVKDALKRKLDGRKPSVAVSPVICQTPVYGKKALKLPHTVGTKFVK